ncbi:DUF2293 domain-containing protein [Aureimonas sp. OT7]|uniref:DUF2293 domain-containing protein n=1 Tax=Aureimonas TaxID=414371 RepID=UPI00177DF685|nr:MULTISPECIES: DUF2293 domain-containing protein [Aureimonas]QOG08330.1 DUF2293 domain-containing protein [Aureimonas sp. OT7]
MATERQRAIDRAMRATTPRIPYLDAETVRSAARSRHLRTVGPDQAFWLAAIAHIRHSYTDYDQLRDEGYDRDAALYFILDAINDVLDRWGSTRRLDSYPEAESEDGAPQPSVRSLGA